MCDTFCENICQQSFFGCEMDEREREIERERFRSPIKLCTRFVHCVCWPHARARSFASFLRLFFTKIGSCNSFLVLCANPSLFTITYAIFSILILICVCHSRLQFDSIQCHCFFVFTAVEPCPNIWLTFRSSNRLM